MDSFLYGLYLDSKILGTAHQIVSFYKNEVFSRKNTIVYIKKYKKTAKKFSILFSKEKIPYKFMSPSDLDDLTGKIIFYPFNAQSNCRFVANRNLTHVFITHGESNKIASIKPIIRIYDYVIAPGDLSIERYIVSNIFNKFDLLQKKIIKMGDTFVGSTGFLRPDRGVKVICYIPTWEGGLARENYSSIGSPLVEANILYAANNFDTRNILIKPHPNTGFRDRKYLQELINLISSLIKQGFKVYLHSAIELFSIVQSFLLKCKGVIVVTSLDIFNPVFAFCDISSIEAQLVNEHIPYNVFLYSHFISDSYPKCCLEVYQNIGIFLDSKSQNQAKFIYQYKFKDYQFSYYDLELVNMNFSQRIEKLVNYINDRDDY